ncbi:MAG: anthranilate phosphoribosyltransferase [Sphingorhabdus sp.]
MANKAQIFDQILGGKLSDGEISNALIQMADRGETAEEIAAAAKAMRARMITAKAPAGAIDVCGTGGDGQHSLNISTTVALVVASLDVPMAKHGNRAASSKAGGADTLEALGLDLDMAAAGAERTLAEIGIGFFFAQNHHPALGPLAPIRKALGRRTIFNLLGPLCNPCGVKRQLIGVATPNLVETYAAAAQMIGYERLMVVSGEEGLDEFSIAGPSKVAMLSGGSITHSLITPEDAGLPRHSLDAIKGGDAAYNARALTDMLAGQEGAYRDAVLLNSAGALMVAGAVDSWEEGVEEAGEAIDKGLAMAMLNCWIANQ